MYLDSQNRTEFNIYLEKLEEYIKNVLKLIQNFSKSVINKITPNHISILYQKMTETSNALKMNDLFYDEYFEFREIEDMIKYTLNRNISIISESDLNLILNLLINFSELIEFKINLIKDNSFNKKKFDVKNEEYSSTLDEYKLYFFDNIYDETLDEDTYVKYCNLIME